MTLAMDNKTIKQKIDEMVEEMIEELKSKLSTNIDSITLTGSYAIGKMSLERPNINILVFVKPRSPASLYLTTGNILYGVGKKYLKYFRFRVDPFPFRFAYPIGDKELEVSVNLNLFEMTNKDLVAWLSTDKKINIPFGAPETVMQGFKSMRKVVFGKDVLGEMEFQVTQEDILLNVIREFPTYKLQLTRAPMTYDIDENYEYLATEALEIGKACIGSLAGVMLDEDAIKKGKHLELIADKRKLLDFLKQSGEQDLVRWAQTIVNARENFLTVKKDKAKVFELYEAAYNVLDKVFELALVKIHELGNTNPK